MAKKVKAALELNKIASGAITAKNTLEPASQTMHLVDSRTTNFFRLEPMGLAGLNAL